MSHIACQSLTHMRQHGSIAGYATTSLHLFDAEKVSRAHSATWPAMCLHGTVGGDHLLKQSV